MRCLRVCRCAASQAWGLWGDTKHGAADAKEDAKLPEWRHGAKATKRKYKA